jgi:molecular chaperone DnaK (HSP70)
VGNIEVVRQWPSSGNMPKTPSTIAYPEENEEEEGMDGVRWGSDTKGLKACLWTKLLLGGDSRQQDMDDPALRELKQTEGVLHIPNDKTPREVVTDYLRELAKWLDARLKVRDEVLYQISPLEIWVTVPAMWTDAAKVATREAVLAAGFGSRPSDSVNIITEPEAAALTVMHERVGMGTISGLEVSETKTELPALTVT